MNRGRSFQLSKRRNQARHRRLIFELLENRRVLAAGFAEFVDPHPAPGNQFGASFVPLSTGNVVITSPYDDAGGADAGAVYLFNGRTGKLISTLIGSHNSDQIGSGGITKLANGNFVVSSPVLYGTGTTTWGDGLIGVSGFAGENNSLIGNGTVIPLTNGNYVVVSLMKDGNGAATFANGKTGISGTVTTDNSLFGEGVGAVTPLSNGNYVVDSTYHFYKGAVTFGNGLTGVTGLVSAANSLVGSSDNDYVGYGNTYLGYPGIVELSNGNYVIVSPDWGGKGAVTFASGTSGIVGEISAENSLIGDTSGDYVGSGGITKLPNGNYVVNSPDWNNGPAYNVGAVTFASGTQGLSGIVSSENSLLGVTADDEVGSGRITSLANGNYVVSSPKFDAGAAVDAGAVTFCSGVTATTGMVTEGNSLVGSATGDTVGAGWFGNGSVVALTNGNYVVSSPHWDNGGSIDVGAVTFGNGIHGINGPVTDRNSLVGSTPGDVVGFGGVTALTNGNYVVSSDSWNNGKALYAGAATWANGESGITGVVSTANSLVGDRQDDNVGSGITPLANGNYVVRSPNWHASFGILASESGAATFGDGSIGTVGEVSSLNSLVGIAYYSSGTRPYGIATVVGLKNGNYLVVTPFWSFDEGAVTFGSGSVGVNGKISALNSLVGSNSGDSVGLDGIVELAGGNYVVVSSGWSSNDATAVGAITWSLGSTGVVGPITKRNSLIGQHDSDLIGSGGVIALSDGNYIVSSPRWANGTLANAGAMTFGYGDFGARGLLTTFNSVFGTAADTSLIPQLLLDSNNQVFAGRSILESGGRIRVGSQIDGFYDRWHLASKPQDVNNDGVIAADDVITIINYINAQNPADVSITADVGKPWGFLDVTADNYIAADDVITIINYINAHPGQQEAPADAPMPLASSIESTANQQSDDSLLLMLASDTASAAKRRK